MGRPKIPLDSVCYSEPHYLKCTISPQNVFIIVSQMLENGQSMDVINMEEFTSMYIPALRSITLNKNLIHYY